MSVVTIFTPPGRAHALTVDDLAGVPDDGRRYELIDGVLVVSPAPTPRHQRALRRLTRLLEDAVPDTAEVFFAPFDVRLSDDTLVQPDLLVAHVADVGPRGLTGPPLLAVEVLSPSTRRFDLHLKKARYEAAGCPSYWVVDPQEPSITAWDLHDHRYDLLGHAAAEQALHLDRPSPVSITPAALVDPPRRG